MMESVMKRAIGFLLVGVIGISAVAWSSGVQAGIVVLPDYTNPANTQLFGDFYVYSMAFLHNRDYPGTNLTPSSPYYVPPTGVQVKDLVVPGAASSGQEAQNSRNIEDAYPMSGGGGGGTTFDYFDTRDNTNFPDPTTSNKKAETGNFPIPVTYTDQLTTWDASVAALRTFMQDMGEPEFLIWFNLNEANTVHRDSPLAALGAEDLLAWVKITLVDTDTGADPKTFYLSAADDQLFNWIGPTVANERLAGLTASADGGPVANPATNPNGTSVWGDPVEKPLDPVTLDPEWAYVHGYITVKGDNSFAHFGPKLSTDPSDYKEISQSLGLEKAAFAIYNPTLSSLIVNDSPYDDLHAEIVFSRLSNGKDQIFVMGGQIEPGSVIPEPASVVVWGVLICFGLAVGWCRRQKRAA